MPVSGYPANIDVIDTGKTNATLEIDDHPGHHNLLASAVLQLQNTLGQNPQDSYTTVASRLRNLRPVFDIRSYGALIDGATDDTVAINSAITAAKNAGGGDVYCPACNASGTPGIIVVNGTVNPTDVQNVRIIGESGAFDVFSDPDYNTTSSPKANGTVWQRQSGSGIMLDWAASAVEHSLSGNGVQGITFDCNGLAPTAIKLTSHFGGSWKDIHIHNPISVGMVLTTIALSRDENLQANDFTNVTFNCWHTQSSKGITMGSGGAGLGNTSLNTFRNLRFLVYNGTAIEMGDSDGNVFLGGAITAAGTAIGVDLLGSNAGGIGHCRSNTFYSLDTGASGFRSRGTATYSTPAANNTVFLNQENAATVTIDAGSPMNVFESTGAISLQNLKPLKARNAAGTADINLAFLDGGNALNLADAGQNVYLGVNSTTGVNPELRLHGYKTGIGVKYASLQVNTSGNVNLSANSNQVLGLEGPGGMHLNFSTGADINMFAGSAGTNRALNIYGWDGAATKTASLKLSSAGVFQVIAPTAGVTLGTATSTLVGLHGSVAAQRAGAAQAAVTTTAATQTTPFGFSSGAQADSIVTLVNEIRAALVEKGIIKGSA